MTRPVSWRQKFVSSMDRRQAWLQAAACAALAVGGCAVVHYVQKHMRKVGISLGLRLCTSRAFIYLVLSKNSVVLGKSHSSHNTSSCVL